MSIDQPAPTTKKRGQGQNLTAAEKRAVQDLFLLDFAKHGVVAKACVVAGVDRSTVYQWKSNEKFLERYNQAFEEAKDAVRAEIFRRAVEGVEEDIYQLGKHCGTMTKYSDTLLIFHAKALMPEYRDKQQIDHTGSIKLKTEWGGGALEEEEE